MQPAMSQPALSSTLGCGTQAVGTSVPFPELSVLCPATAAHRVGVTILQVGNTEAPPLLTLG